MDQKVFMTCTRCQWCGHVEIWQEQCPECGASLLTGEAAYVKLTPQGNRSVKWLTGHTGQEAGPLVSEIINAIASLAKIFWGKQS